MQLNGRLPSSAAVPFLCARVLHVDASYGADILNGTLSTEISFRSFYILIMSIICILFYFLPQKFLDLS